MKCHRCEKEVVKPWLRGALTFCSEACRKASLDGGEELSLGPGDATIEVKGQGKP